MTYQVMAVADEWVELWDGETFVDPDWPGEKHTARFYVGTPNPYLVGDVVRLEVRLVVRITPPEEVAAARKAVEGTEYQWSSDEELLGRPS